MQCTEANSAQLGAESPLYWLLDRLTAQAGARPPGEALEAWLRRIGVWDAPDMAIMARRHQRRRFDPAGLPPQEQQDLVEAVAAWLAQTDKRI